MENSDSGSDLVLIAKYLDGQADDLEIEMVQKWIGASDENRQEFQKLKKAWDLASAGIAMEEWQGEGAKERLLLKMIKAQSVSSPRFSMLKYAAIAIVLLGTLSILVFKFFTGRSDAAPGKHFTEIAATRGSKINLTLEDGSKIVLNAGSTLKYGSDFNQRDRNIFLVGEAYFEVAKNASKPFNVYAGDITVHAIGTIFNVKAYPEDRVVETTLVEGSVSVEAKNGAEQKIILQPKEQVYYYKPAEPMKEQEKILISKGIEPEQYTSWINGQLVISNETLGSLAVKLERKYDVSFHFADETIRELRYTGVLRNETIEQILEILKLSSPLNYKMEKREIWIDKN